MGVPAFYRWLSEKYPKIVQYVLEERVQLAGDSTILPFDSTRPNPSQLECDNFYIDMNGIIHPCSHPENGIQPSTEVEMYENICHYIDRLFRSTRPRKLLYLAIDGVAPRAKMNQQRSRRFRSAQEAREHAELENEIKDELLALGHQFDVKGGKAWDSNVITPGTQFMLNLSEYIQFYIRKRISEDKAWKNICVIFSDASIPGEGEHKIMDHIRRQRTHPHYCPNSVHLIHGLDADLIMLALATHEPHIYILREEILFGRRSAEHAIQYQNETGFTDAQRQLDEAAGSMAMNLKENQHKPLIRLSIPILREYIASEFKVCERVPFRNGPDFERLIDDIVFLCFFVGNDFLPHLPSLDIRDGALDFLFNVYKRVLPSLGDYITSHGGEVNLSHVDVILAEVGAIEDYVFSIKHENEQKQKNMRKEQSERDTLFDKLMSDKEDPASASNTSDGTSLKEIPKVIGRAARIIEQDIVNSESKTSSEMTFDQSGTVALRDLKDERERSRLGKFDRKSTQTESSDIVNGTASKHDGEESKIPEEMKSTQAKARSAEENFKAAQEFKTMLARGETTKDVPSIAPPVTSTKRKRDNFEPEASLESNEDGNVNIKEEVNEGDDDDIYEQESDIGDDQLIDDSEDIVTPELFDIKPELFHQDETSIILKSKLKEAREKKLDDFATTVQDKVRLHEKGWKDRYYSDKCKADDVAENGGREHLFRSYIVGLCWVMKYYYDGCPSWKWYYPFHYAPFASDLRNIERFRKYCIFELGTPFRPVEQLMAVLPEDSSHALPEACRWLMSDPNSPIIDFYPKEILCDPNGKAMPWLWVVLLPFIDEKRLLDALKPTMPQWTEKEQLCNVRGPHDGYIFIHSSHNLALLLLSDKLTGGALTLDQYCERKVFGKIHRFDKIKNVPMGETLIISTACDDFGCVSVDSLFNSITCNAAACGTFVEPPKLTHMSILLQGVQLSAPILTEDDKRIRRPRLNGRGGTIANLGFVAQQQSQQIGYGSMNISSYERELAERTGRGNQMNQTGIRSWGSMEPTQKKYHVSQPSSSTVQSHFKAPFIPQQYVPPPGYTTTNTAPQRMPFVPPQMPAQRWMPPMNNNIQLQQPMMTHIPPPPPPPPPPPATVPNKNSFQRSMNQSPHSNFSYSHRMNTPVYPPHQHPNNPSIPHSSQGYNHQAPRSQVHGQETQGSKLSDSKMHSLRAQLAKTLQQNQRGSN